MATEIRLGVYRRLDNRLEGLSDDSPRALELHEQRKRALHEVLDTDTAWTVLSWGDTDDTRAHEWVELLLILGPSLAPIATEVIPALTFLGGIIVTSAVDLATSEAIKKLIAKLRKKQEDKQLRDFEIALPDGSKIRLDPPDYMPGYGSQLTITLTNGQVRSIHYDATREDIAKIEADSA